MVHTFQVTTGFQSSVLIDSLLVNPRRLFCGNYKKVHGSTRADLGGGCKGCAPPPPPPPPEMTCGFLIQLVFCKKKTMWIIGVEVEQETSAPPPEKNPGSAPCSKTYRGCVHMSKAGKILSNFTSSIAPLRIISPLCK